MGAFISYLLQVGLVMALLFLSYKVLLSSATFHAFKRFTLLGVLLASWVLPLAMPKTELPVSHSVSGSVPVAQPIEAGTAEGSVEIGVPMQVEVVDSSGETVPHGTWFRWLVPVYGGRAALCAPVYLGVRPAACSFNPDGRQTPSARVHRCP